VQGLLALNDKELGAINRYTSGLYKPLVAASNRLGTGNVATGDLNKMDWDSPLQSLKYSGPILRALSSGLAKLPVYTGTVYRILESGSSAWNTSDGTRRSALSRYKRGAVETQAYPMSTSKTLNSKFIKNHYAMTSFDTIYEIRNIRSGHDIQLASDQFEEEEVLFQPGSRLRIVDTRTSNPNDATDKHLWVVLEEM
jgi:hypothetical protein